MQLEKKVQNPTDRSARSASVTSLPTPLRRQSPSRHAPGSPASPVRQRSSVSTPAPLNRSLSLSQMLKREARQEALERESQASRDSGSSLGDKQPRIDTPEPSRSSAPSHAALGDARSDLDTLLGTLMDPLRTQAGKPASDVLRLMDALLEIPQATFTGMAADMIAAKSTDELTALLIGLAVVRSKVPAGDQLERLLTLASCARALLPSRMGAGAPDLLAALEAAATKLAAEDETGAGQLQEALAVLPDESLLVAAHSQHEGLYWLARGEAALRHDRSGRKAAQAMADVRLLAGQPHNMDEWMTDLSDAARRVEAHERCCGLFDKPISREVTAARATLGTALRGLLERGGIPLHRATPAQRQALCRALARLGVPVDPLRTEHQAQTAFMGHCVVALLEGKLEKALTLLKAAKSHLGGMTGAHEQTPCHGTRAASRENLQAQLLDDVLKRLPPAQLRQLAEAMDGNDTRSLMAAMSHLCELPQVGEPLGKELAERHHDLMTLRQAVNRTLGEPPGPEKKIPLDDAARNTSVCSALLQAFALEVRAGGKGLHVLARNGPVGADTQAVFDRAFARDALSNRQPSTQVSGMAIANSFAATVGRIGLRVFNRHTGGTDVLNVKGKTVSALVDTLQERTGATPAQMVAMSRIFDADSRIDSAMLSHAGALRLPDGPVVLPVVGRGMRASSVEFKCDDKGNLRLRFHTALTGIAGFAPIEGQLRQMLPAAPDHDAASFTHEVVISREGKCSAPQLHRDASALPAARAFDYRSVLLAKDLLLPANAALRSTLEQTIKRTRRPSGTPAQLFMPASPSGRQAALAQSVIDEARAVLDADRASRN